MSGLEQLPGKNAIAARPIDVDSRVSTTEHQVRQNRRPPVVSDVPRPGTQPPPRTDNYHHGDVHWDTSWRNNHHYDWHNYRNHHRSRFHLGFYIESQGGVIPYRVKIRGPSFVTLAVTQELCRNVLLADVPAIVGSIDIVMGEVDR